jgi:hypothetical protein
MINTGMENMSLGMNGDAGGLSLNVDAGAMSMGTIGGGAMGARGSLDASAAAQGLRQTMQLSY